MQVHGSFAIKGKLLFFIDVFCSISSPPPPKFKWFTLKTCHVIFNLCDFQTCLISFWSTELLDYPIVCTFALINENQRSNNLSIVLAVAKDGNWNWHQVNTCPSQSTSHMVQWTHAMYALLTQPVLIITMILDFPNCNLLYKSLELKSIFLVLDLGTICVIKLFLLKTLIPHFFFTWNPRN